MQCSFRLAHEGLGSIINFIGESRKIQIDKNDLVLLLQNNDHRTPPEIHKLSLKTQEQVKELPFGSCILIYKEQDLENSSVFKLEMVGWRGTMSLRAYIAANDAAHYLRLVGADCSMYEKNKFQTNQSSLSSKDVA